MKICGINAPVLGTNDADKFPTNPHLLPTWDRWGLFNGTWLMLVTELCYSTRVP